MDPIRLNKALANAGICSRRKADEWIAAGLITVNGLTVTEAGCKIVPSIDHVAIQGKDVIFEAKRNEVYYYIVLHKPIQVVCTAHDPEGRKTVLDFLPAELSQKRLYPVGRLDYFSEGLLLLTDDGDLTYRLTHPKYHLSKEYLVTVREVPTDRMFSMMQKGMTLAEGEHLAPVEVKTTSNPKQFKLILHQGINRQIRRMCRDLGLTILRLQRIAMGPLTLGELPKGQTRELTEKEVHDLRLAVGLQA